MFLKCADLLKRVTFDTGTIELHVCIAASHVTFDAKIRLHHPPVLIITVTIKLILASTCCNLIKMHDNELF